MLYCLQLIVYKVIIMTLVEYGLLLLEHHSKEITDYVTISSCFEKILASHNRCDTKCVTQKVRWIDRFLDLWLKRTFF